MSNELGVSQRKYAWIEQFGGEEAIKTLGINLKSLSNKADTLGLTFKEDENIKETGEPVLNENIGKTEGKEVEDTINESADVESIKEDENEELNVKEQINEMLEFFAKDVIAPILELVKQQNTVIEKQNTSIEELKSKVKELSKTVSNNSIENAPAVSMAEAFKAFLFDGNVETFGTSSKVNKEDGLAKTAPKNKQLDSGEVIKGSANLEDFLLA